MWNIFVFFCYLAIVCTNFGKAKCDDSQLPGDVEPLFYDLQISPNFNTFKFSGLVVITIRVRFSTNVIKLHCKNFKLSDTWSQREQTSDGEFVDIAWTQKDDLCILTNPSPLKYGETYKFRVAFEGELKEDGGMYRLSYLENGVEKWLVATNFYGTYAREAFPCFDEPRFRTPFKLTIARTKTQKVISNMPLKKSQSCTECDQNVILDTFQTSPPIPTYLVAFVIFEYSSQSHTNDMIKIWTRTTLQPKAQFALSQSDKVLTQLENFISVPYEAPKLDIVTIKTPYSLTENWGLYTFQENYLIADEPRLSQMQKIITTASMCHLFARHWFGGQVTPAAWHYSWLTEAFAGYLEFFVTHLVEPDWKIDALFNVEVLQSALWSELSGPGALTRSVVSESQINQKYGSINYNKGASVIRMLEHIVSRSSLRSALQKYLIDSKKLRNGVVKPDDLFQALQFQSDIDSFPLPPHITITDVMKSWTENIGYPVINVTRNYKTNELEIRQQTYKSRQTTVSFPDHQQWITPLSYTTKSKASFSKTAPSEWVTKDDVKTLSIKVENPDWIICNLQRTGYYRVSYDTRNWNSLIVQLKEDPQKIHVLNRAQLIDDSFTFAFDGGLSYNVALKLGEYLEQETEMVPLLSALFHFEKLYEKYEDTELQVFFCMYIKKILEKQIELIGFDIKSTDSYITKMAKPKLLFLACKIGLHSCVQAALTEYDSNSKDLSKVQPDLKEVVYCTALKYAQDDETIYKDLWATYQASDIAYDKIVILKSLGCSRNENLLKNTLSKLFDQKEPDMDKTYRISVCKSILSSSRGVTAALKFIHEQIAKISACNTDDLTFMQTLLGQTEPKVRSNDHFRTLKTIKQDLDKLDCKTLADFMSTVQRIRISGINLVKENNRMRDILRPIFYDLLDIPALNVPAKQTSNSFFLIPSSFSFIICLFVAIIFNHS